MKIPITRALLIISLVTSLTGCAAVGRTLNSAMKIPQSILNFGTRTIGSIGG